MIDNKIIKSQLKICQLVKIKKL